MGLGWGMGDGEQGTGGVRYPSQPFAHTLACLPTTRQLPASTAASIMINGTGFYTSPTDYGSKVPRLPSLAPSHTHCGSPHSPPHTPTASPPTRPLTHCGSPHSPPHPPTAAARRRRPWPSASTPTPSRAAPASSTSPPSRTRSSGAPHTNPNPHSNSHPNTHPHPHPHPNSHPNSHLRYPRRRDDSLSYPYPHPNPNPTPTPTPAPTPTPPEGTSRGATAPGSCAPSPSWTRWRRCPRRTARRCTGRSYGGAAHTWWWARPAMPLTPPPLSLTRYGTHVVVGVTIGGTITTVMPYDPCALAARYAFGPPRNASGVWTVSHIQARQPALPAARYAFGPPGWVIWR